MKHFILSILLSISIVGFSQPFDHTPSETIIYREVDLFGMGQQINTKGSLEIDIDDDGVIDFFFEITPVSGSNILTRVHPTKDRGATKILSIDAYDCINSQHLATSHDIGTTLIDANSNAWNGQDIDASGPKVYIGILTCDLSEGFLGKDYKYLGVQFRKDGATHYAWLKMKASLFGQEGQKRFEIRVSGIAYESVANKGIVAGDDGKEVVETIEISGNTVIDEDYGTLQLSTTISPQEANTRRINWSLRSGDETYASIDTNGNVQALKNGVIRVYATAYDINQVSDSIDITITNQKIHIESINIVAKAGGELKIDTDYGTLDLEAEIVPANADESFKNMTWSLGIPGQHIGSAEIDSVTGIIQAFNNQNVQFQVTSSDPNGASKQENILISNQTTRIASLELIVLPSGTKPIIDTDGGRLMYEIKINGPSNNFSPSLKLSNDNFAEISDANNSRYFVNAKNNGTVELITHWEDPSVENRIVSDTVEITITNQVTGFFSTTNKTESLLYPNPVVQNSFVTIDRNEVINHIEVYSLSGQLIKTSLIKNQKIDLNGLEKGVYFIRFFIDEKSFYTEKLIIK